jgi:putative signal transducing protein
MLRAAMTNADLIVIGTYRDEMGAEIARSVLEAADIDSMIQGDSVRGPSLWMTGYRLLVRAEDVKQATEILGPPSRTSSVALAEPDDE